MRSTGGSLADRGGRGGVRSGAALLAVALMMVSNAALARVSHGYSAVFTIDNVTAVGDAGVPGPTRIADIYPNPFNPRATIAFFLAEPGQTDLTVYDLAGRLVRRLDSGFRAGGRYEASWDGRDDQGRNLATGTYFCRLTTSSGSSTRKMMLTK